MSKECIWYISKYVVPSNNFTTGGRGYMLMRELAKLGYTCLIFASNSSEYSQTPDMKVSYQKEMQDGLSFWWVRTLKYVGARSLKRILSWLHFEWRLLLMPKSDLPKPDVIVVSSLSILTIFNGFILRKIFGCKLIFEVRDIWPLTLTEEGGFSKANPFIFCLSLVEKLGYKYSDSIVGTMPNLSEHVARVLGYKRAVSCVPMGLDIDRTDEILPLPAGYKENYLPDNSFLVAHAGSIGITNSLETFLACAESFIENTEIKFVIVGDGYLKAEYQKRYRHLTNLIFAPKVPRKMVQSVLQECHLLYFAVPESEVWKYGQSLNKVIDYMLSGKPVVASYSGYESMINEAQCGSYVAVNNIPALRNEIIRYSELSDLKRNEIGLRGREWLLNNRNYSSLAIAYSQIMFGK
jgi:glycosyltransferase involved in cell wall biosynthesis